MKKIITDLWNGNTMLSDECGKNDPEINELLRLMEQNRETLNKMLETWQQEIVGKYMDCVEEYMELVSEQAFSLGFSHGCRLLVAALDGGS